jgi:hypothetical protein
MAAAMVRCESGVYQNSVSVCNAFSFIITPILMMDGWLDCLTP